MQLHTREVNTRVSAGLAIYARDQAKFKSSEFAQKLTQPSKHFFLFK